MTARARRKHGKHTLPCALLLSLFWAQDARAQDATKPTSTRMDAASVPVPVKKAKSDDDEEVTEEHTEAAGIPAIGGSTDIGISFGVAGSVAHVAPGVRPYVWKIDGLLGASIKGGPDGLEIVQQSYDIRLDVPHGAGNRVRIMPAVIFERTINSGYFGLGNQAPVITDKDGEVGRRYQFQHMELRARVNVRAPLAGPFDQMHGLTLRYLNPQAYENSRLAIDGHSTNDDGTPLIRGLQPLGIAVLSSGAIYDTRDDEITPVRGAFHLVGLRGAVATPTSSEVRWGGLNVLLRNYHRIGEGPFVFAHRLFVDLMAGNVPFYDLSQGGAFTPIDLPGGPQGIRGIPNGRYSGLVKAVANAEMRVFWGSVRLFGERFRVGNNVFFDAGRIWKNYTFDDPRDGDTLGLKFGAGAGFLIKVGTAAAFRMEAAYSPDASAANPGFPIGIYVADSLMF